MDHTNPDIIEQFKVAIYKSSSWIGWILLGLTGKFSYDLLRNKKLTWSYMLGTSGIALFAGYVGGVYIFATYPEKAPILVPTITLLSNNFVAALMAIDWKAILKKDWRGAFEYLMRNDKK